MDSTIEWFAKKHIQIDTSLGSREYSAEIVAMPKIKVIPLSAHEIPKELAVGRIDLGITGQDLVRETVPAWREDLSELKLLNFGRAKLVLAVPNFWVDVDTIDDFDAVAINFRKQNGFRLRIATKYHNLIWSYLRKMGVADYQLVDSQGATEGTVKNHTAEAIADITSSGRTLKANHLKVVGEQPVFTSQATLFLSRIANWTPTKYQLLEEFTRKLSIPKREILSLANSKLR